MLSSDIRQATDFVDDLNIGTTAKHSAEVIDAVLSSLADVIATEWNRNVNLDKVTKRDATLVLLTLGATEQAARDHGAKLARKLRSLRFSHGSWSSVI